MTKTQHSRPRVVKDILDYSSEEQKIKKALIFAMLIASLTVALPVSAQTIVKGHVINERGETVEYVTIGFEEGRR